MKRIVMIMMIGAVSIFANTEMMSIDRNLELKDRELKNYTKYDLINRSLTLNEREKENYSKYDLIDRSLELKDRELKNTHKKNYKIFN